MKKRLYSILVVTIMITISIFAFASNSSLAIGDPRDPPPVYQASFTWTTEDDGKNYYAYEYTFNGQIAGGIPPYDFKWEWDDGTDPDYENGSTDIYTTAEHKFFPAISEHEYNVKLTVTDSHTPNPWTTWKDEIVTVHIDYNIWIDRVQLKSQDFAYGEEPVEGWAHLKNSESYHICPKFVKYKVQIWEWVNILEGYEPLEDPEFWEETEIGIDLNPSPSAVPFYFNLGYPPICQGLDHYFVKATITYAPFDRSDWRHDEDSVIFVVS